MPICNRNLRQINGCRAARGRRNGTAETVAEELYNATANQAATLRCCDRYGGCRDIDARRRHRYWPSFAHPRWLTCAELNSRRLCSRYR